MREISFRAWDNSEDKMIYESDARTVGTCLMINLEGLLYDEAYDRHRDDFPLNVMYDLMQYTGMKDKNGKKIYKCDIIKVQYDDKDEPEFIDQVIWGLFEDCCAEGETWVTGQDRWQRCIYYWLEWAEVIGNTYENPELLEKIL